MNFQIIAVCKFKKSDFRSLVNHNRVASQFETGVPNDIHQNDLEYYEEGGIPPMFC